jgi:hypothetical protein
MRALIFSAIVGDSVLNGLGITDASSFAVDVDTPEDRPFLQLRWGQNLVGLKKTRVTRRTLTIWVHDRPGDYSVKIDPIILRLRELLPTLEGISNGLGHVVAVEWSGDSEDLADDGHGTITRNVSFELVGSGQ